jgi:hypothetical protein
MVEMLRHKIINLEGFDTTTLADMVLSTLHEENEYYTIDCEKSLTIKWNHHVVIVNGKSIWLDNKPQHSVYNILNLIKAESKNI